MSLGASFALTPDQVSELMACSDDDARVEWLEELEEAVPDDAWFQFDKAWDALHRCLGDGRLEMQFDGRPVALAVFGSQALMEDPDADVFAGLLTADEVPLVAEALAEVDEEWLRARYATLDRTDYDQPLDDEDFDYTWDALVELRRFLDRAGRDGLAVVFTVAG